jgi:peptidoglycan hydrolase CwlO-like protein
MQESLLKIVASLSELDHFSDNLEQKVDRLLQAQENTFVESYQQHIGKIETEFDRLHRQINELQEKIRYY